MTWRVALNGVCALALVVTIVWQRRTIRKLRDSRRGAGKW